MPWHLTNMYRNSASQYHGGYKSRPESSSQPPHSDSLRLLSYNHHSKPSLQLSPTQAQMAQLADAVHTVRANADLDRRNDGIALIEVDVVYGHPTCIKYKWSSHRRSPKKFTVWLRNVKTQEHYKAKETVWTSAGEGQVKINSLPRKTGEYQLVLTEYNDYDNTYARSSTFWIYKSDF
ncbi:hypothetical protein M407DRAFT_26486 [Tulasnella calospora MUT 4182]|uniref:Uncharacterized protein n=1 Tax=Tulasnella calospora MUT 4182 TaxID=1051891 RepID=A0A0C3LRU1_9AGAM|nr:hypothetical protein M407DRAFT_26486 [Tulasnella calospora MUT 4182]